MGDLDGHGSLPKRRIKALHRGPRTGPYDDHLIIALPNFMVLRVLARLALLAFALAALTWHGFFFDSSSPDNNPQNLAFIDDRGKVQILQPQIGLIPTLFGDLIEQSFLKIDDRALYIGTSAGANEFQSLISQGLVQVEFDMVSDIDSDRQLTFLNDSYDFVFAHGFHTVQFVERTLKKGGMAAINLSLTRSSSFRLPPSFKIVYVRRFESHGSGSTVITVRKIAGNADIKPQSQRICAASDARKARVRSLESILLEPPRPSWVKSKQFIRRAKFLPCLTNDSLDSYSRRVLVNVSAPGSHRSGSGDWFERHYPTGNHNFEVYNVAVETHGGSELVAPGMLSKWLAENVKEEEFVVMKIEADGLGIALMEEMMKSKSKALCLVNELFLRCPHKEEGKKYRKPYWECLALYGMLREEGIAVHQWWG